MFIQNGAWDIIIMFKKSKLEKNNKFQFNIGRFVSKALSKIRSIRVRMFIFIFAISVIPFLIIVEVVNQYYRANIISQEIIGLQTSATVLAEEFSEYSTFSEAEKAGTYSSLRNYSTVNSFRIRVVDVNFVIVMDSYYIDTDKSVLNHRAVNTYISGKNTAEYDSKTGTMEAITPVYNSAGKLMGLVMIDKDISEVDEFMLGVMEQLSVAVFSVVVLIGAVLFVVCRFSGKSVKAALKTVEDVALGHTDKRISVKGCTELREFAGNFNTIMDKASDLDQNRQEFVSNVSHELKTPITSIKVLADALNMQEDAPIELYKEFMQDITSEIDRESKIIEDLLSLVKMDKSADSMNITSVNINELLEIILKRLKPIAQKKNVEILFESFRPVVAEIDEVKFTQVISNLVENAIKYNKFDGWVHVSLNADYQYFYVRVEDSGIGIPKESQDKVFDRFYRVDKARSRETGGTGLGLAIVQKIILMHHGTVKLHSEEGTGTTFTVRIPLNYVG